MKLAYHILTGDRVAIKIMDKHTLGVRLAIIITVLMGHHSNHIYETVRFLH